MYQKLLLLALLVGATMIHGAEANDEPEISLKLPGEKRWCSVAMPLDLISFKERVAIEWQLGDPVNFDIFKLGKIVTEKSYYNLRKQAHVITYDLDVVFKQQ